jgi:hypothetical protein
MSGLSQMQIFFLAVNAALGLAVGTVAARSPDAAPLQLPAFAWLVAGMFLFELVAGFLLKKHPSAIISMPVRVAGLVVSVVLCYLMVAALKAA